MPGKKVKIPARGEILEAAKDPGDQRAAWKRMLGDAQRCWHVMPVTGSRTNATWFSTFTDEH